MEREAKMENNDSETEVGSGRSTQWVAETFTMPHEILFVVTICMSQFLTQGNIGVGLAAMDIVGDSFNITDPGELTWFMAGYSLTVGTFILVFGRCGDYFGYDRMYLIGWLWLALWSLVAGLSVYSNAILFIIARVLQGLGPAMMLPNGLALLGATYPPGRRKAMVFAIFGGTAPSGSVVSSIFTAIFSQFAWWPWTYWSMAIVCLVCALVGHLVIVPIRHSPSPDTTTTPSLWHALDLPGAITGITGLVLVNIAWNQAPTVSWHTPYVIVLLLLGALFLALFFYIEFNHAPNPLIPFHAFSTDVSFVLTCISAGWGTFSIWIFYTWRFLLDTRAISPLLASAQFTPPIATGMLAAVLTGFLIVRIQPSWIMLMSLTAFTTGALLIAVAPIRQTYWAQTFVSLCITPFGMDMSFPAATLMLSNAVPREHQGLAASLVATVVNYSVSLALGFAGTIESNVVPGHHSMAADRDPAAVMERLKGYRAALYFAVGLGGLGIGLSAFYVLRGYTKPKKGGESEEEGSE